MADISAFRCGLREASKGSPVLDCSTFECDLRHRRRDGAANAIPKLVDREFVNEADSELERWPARSSVTCGADCGQ
jgi:hypothetical protein